MNSFSFLTPNSKTNKVRHNNFNFSKESPQLREVKDKKDVKDVKYHKENKEIRGTSHINQITYFKKNTSRFINDVINHFRANNK